IGMMIAGVLMVSLASPAVSVSITYTTDADFDQGILNGVNHDAVHDQLQLNKTVTTFPVMWVANAGEDTVSKIDTKTGRELARYRTWFGPAGQSGYLNHLGNAYAGAAPSRTAVDIDGNVYVANRHFDGKIVDVIKILAHGGIDRNGNGVIDTSNDTNNNGVIDPSEIYPMNDSNSNGTIDPNEIQDERIAWIKQVGPPNGLGRSLAIDPDGNIWAGLYNSRAYYKINSLDGSVIAGPIDVSPNTPYGALVDGNGTLWGASLDNTLLKLDTKTLTKKIYSHSGSDYGIALGNNKVYMGCPSGCSFIQFDTVTEIFSFPAAINYGTLGIAVDANGNILVGKNNGGITKFRPNGSVIWDAPPQPGAGEARGVQVDSDNNVWSINRPTNNISKYNGTDGVPLGVFSVGDQPYTYSDATGLGLRMSILTGTWTVIYDSGTAGIEWGRISWNGSVPAGASINVTLRTADTIEGLQLATYQQANNNEDFSATGRFIQIETRLTANPSKDSPLLYDLTVQSKTAGKRGKVVGWGTLGHKAAPELTFKIFAYTEFISKGTVETEDDAGNKIKATEINSVITNRNVNPMTGEIKGKATFNGAGPYDFLVKVTDGGDPSRAPYVSQDTFEISIPTNNYHKQGGLTAGNMQVIY
ncbi:MAG TPA: hypothetical protein VIO58_05385, partial [Candidatus Methanoperedens sp.]